MNINIEPYISVVPRVFHTGESQKITIKSKHDFVHLKGVYSVSILPRYEYQYNSELGTAHYDSFDVEAVNNELSFYYEFGVEQEYNIFVEPHDKTGRNVQGVKTSVYALDSDLYGKKVMKGDLHLHTTFSAGLETPEHRAVVARKNGFDFIAITDHNNYLGSIHLREKMDRCKTNMIFIRGEEVHAAKCPVHILSLGANKAIAPQVTEITDEQKQILLDLVDLYSGKVDEKVDIRAFVAAMDVFNKIKDAGGVSVLCHIYWDAVDTMHHNRMGAPEQLINALVNECKFDAFEITSGAPESDLKANYLQEIYYREKLPMNFPIIGITDSHTTLEAMTIFGKNYTIAFTDDRSEMGVLNALRQGLTVSVDGVGSNVICHGSLRLVKYASFLRERSYQRHDELARLEALLMERVLNENYDYISPVETVCDDNNMLMNEEWKVIM